MTSSRTAATSPEMDSSNSQEYYAAPVAPDSGITDPSVRHETMMVLGYKVWMIIIAACLRLQSRLAIFYRPCSNKVNVGVVSNHELWWLIP